MSYANTIFSPAYFFQSKSAKAKVDTIENNNAEKQSRKIEPFTVNKPTFNNDQFNELLLYIFTGIFLLVLIDYIYKLGKKSF